MKRITFEEEITGLKAELSASKKMNKKLSQKLEKSKCKTAQLQKELKKNDVRKITLSKEQEQSLSNLSKDIDILNLLSD